MKQFAALTAALLICASAWAVIPDEAVLSGGVGDEEREAMKQEYDEYNLHLAFAEKSPESKKAEFVSDVDVAIRDAKGREVWQGKADGPMLFAKLPPGRYTVSASYEGKTKQKTVQVGPKSGPLYTVLFS